MPYIFYPFNIVFLFSFSVLQTNLSIFHICEKARSSNKTVSNSYQIILTFGINGCMAYFMTHAEGTNNFR